MQIMYKLDQKPHSVMSDLGLHCCQGPFYGIQFVKQNIKHSPRSTKRYLYIKTDAQFCVGTYINYILEQSASVCTTDCATHNNI